MPASPETTSTTQGFASPVKHESAWSAFWSILIRFQREKMAPRIALRNTLGVALPLIAGAAAGNVASGLTASTGALNVGFSDSDEPYARRARKMIATSVLVGIAVFTGSLTAHNHLFAVLLATVWALVAGMLVALSTAAADVGVISLVTLLVYAAAPQSIEHAAAWGLFAFGGGILQTVLSLAFWPLRRYNPERRTLGGLFQELSRVAAAPGPATQAPQATAETMDAHDSLAALHRDHSIEGERYRSLLSQAERIRLSLHVLSRLRVRISRERAKDTEARILDEYLEIAARLLGLIGDSLLSGPPASGAPDLLGKLQRLADRMREAHSASSSAVAAMIGDARFHMDALTGQTRSALDLAAYASPGGVIAFEAREAAKPWRLRIGSTIATLRANLSLSSAACRHALRMAACVAIGDAIGRSLDLSRSYWLPMTVAIVLKPDFTATFSRGVLRLIGTAAGLVFATGLFHILPPTNAARFVLITCLMFSLRCFGPANYGIFVTAVTALVVLLIAGPGVAPKEVIAARFLNTVAGGIIALLAYAAWPTWERAQVPEAMARLLDAYRAYFRAIHHSYVQPDVSRAVDLDQTRAGARLARSNLEASIDRYFSEPGTSPQNVSALGAMLASSHRLIHAIMALDAGLARSHPVPARNEFKIFDRDVELTLYYLAATLRGSPLTRRDLPDLREDHHSLVQSGDPLTERYALVNVETDRITNSLNTLSEELLSWLFPGTKKAG
jgi:uncharacterized membrane protein YccC